MWEKKNYFIFRVSDDNKENRLIFAPKIYINDESDWEVWLKVNIKSGKSSFFFLPSYLFNFYFGDITPIKKAEQYTIPVGCATVSTIFQCLCRLAIKWFKFLKYIY